MSQIRIFVGGEQNSRRHEVTADQLLMRFRKAEPALAVLRRAVEPVDHREMPQEVEVYERRWFYSADYRYEFFVLQGLSLDEVKLLTGIRLRGEIT